MGFFTRPRVPWWAQVVETSQSLSGWDGVFHLVETLGKRYPSVVSQSLSGWDGVFHGPAARGEAVAGDQVAIPFRVGWGFSQVTVKTPHVFLTIKSQSLSGWDGVFHAWPVNPRAERSAVAIPFRVGRGFSHEADYGGGSWGDEGVAIPFRVGWGFSPKYIGRDEKNSVPVAIPFRVGWGFSPEV